MIHAAVFKGWCGVKLPLTTTCSNLMPTGTALATILIGGGTKDTAKLAPATTFGSALRTGRSDTGGEYCGVNGGPGIAIAAILGRLKACDSVTNKHKARADNKNFMQKSLSSVSTFVIKYSRSLLKNNAFFAEIIECLLTTKELRMESQISIHDSPLNDHQNQADRQRVACRL
jgi:hypothetical protein